MQPERQGDRTLRGYLGTLRRRRGVVLLAMVLVPATAIVASAMQRAEYEASAQVLLRQGTIPGDVLSGLQSGSNLMDRVLRTQAQVAHGPDLARRVVAAVPTEDLSAQGLLRRSSVAARPDADILVFSVRNADPRLTQQLANEYARQYTRYRRQLLGVPVRKALADLGASAGAGVLARRARQLRTQQALGGADAADVAPADTARKIRPETLRNGVFGLLLGTLFGVGLAFLWQALDTRLRSAAEIGDGLGLPLLGRVPSTPHLFGDASLPMMLSDPQSREAEAFRFLRANPAFADDPRGARTVMVTCAHPGEGMSTVAANLAVALAGAGRRVTLVDLDLRRPSLARSFGLEGGAGLTEVALGSATLDEAVVTIPMPEPSTGALRVLTSGPPPPDPAEFHMTQALESILEKVRSASDLVIIDSPPLLGSGDVVTLGGKVDSILVVARRGVLRRSALPELRRVLDRGPAAKLGFVLSDAQPDGRPAGSGRRRDRSSHPAARPLTTSS
jgi:succinoglycan biosynthesis transport protein ExoP